jgi:alpha-beta hydrolase superfamily lysophospholipase
MLPTLVLAGGLGLVPKPPSPSPAAAVTFTTSDGVTVYADSYAGPSPKAPVIQLFHQAESSRNEYAPIAPRLVELGYNVLAVDQRSGGDLYPPANETVQHLGRSADYIDVLPDMNGALAWAQRTYPGAPVIAWGSSYSAALVFAFAASHPRDLAAVLAFSPGEYLPDKGFVNHAARHVRVPVFIDSASVPNEESAARAIFLAVRSRLKVDYVPKAGVHGSSTLRDDRDPGGAAENWQAVTDFLARLHAAAPAKS